MTIQGEAKIVLRWEWRTFDASLNAIEGRIAAALEQVAPHTSAEIYLLRLGGPQNTKIRDGILDVKRLQQVDVNGLELWEPVLKAKFPLSQNDVATAFLEWQLSLPGLGRNTYTIDQFTNQLIVAQPHLRVAPVTKSRRRFTFAACMAEFVRLSVDSLYLESFSLEHEQTGPIVAALNDLGLVNVSNINYPLALKRALKLEGDIRNSNQQGAARA
jgi:exopolyphosphatase / guanosine-5'-triphosphate,3'-diphosphate pyrophosphatase